mgnify:CR=1 FL=1
MLCVDSTFLGLLIHPDAVAGEPVDRLQDRLEMVRKSWDVDREKIIIPTPVLSEFLILAGNDGPAYLDKIHKTSNFEIKPFDEMAAIELAAIQVGITNKQSKSEQKRSSATGTWAKIKFDRQIVAIAKANNASAIYSDDDNVKTFAEAQGIKVIKTRELPLPEPEAPGLFDWLSTSGEIEPIENVENEPEIPE